MATIITVLTMVTTAIILTMGTITTVWITETGVITPIMGIITTVTIITIAIRAIMVMEAKLTMLGKVLESTVQELDLQPGQ